MFGPSHDLVTRSITGEENHRTRAIAALDSNLATVEAAGQDLATALIMDMLTYHQHPFIDTRSPRSMLRDLARIIMQGPMARHTMGPAANFFGDLFHLYEAFDLDMIWMAGHIGCKNTQALAGMFREKCRRRGIPLLIIAYDLSDTRVVTPAGIRRQVDMFMGTVIEA